MSARNPARGWALPLAALAGAGLTGGAYWPGLMSWDAISQYGQVLSGAIDDWHPPVMQWVWVQLHRVHGGPAPMLLLQLTLYWGGLALLATGAARARPVLGWAVLACGFLPLGLAFTGMILKDALMAAALLAAAGAARFGGERALPVKFAAGALLLFAACLRFNAFLACLPLMVALARAPWRRGWRLAATTAAAAALLMAAMPIANALIGARHRDAELSLIIFDVGGITEQAGVDAFPMALGVPDAVLINHACYRAIKWDNYADWMKPECPLGIDAWRQGVASGRVDVPAIWARAVLAHPLAYATHRLTHFAINTRLLPLDETLPTRGDHDDPEYGVTPNPVLRALSGLATATARTPLGWPITWLGVALGVLIGSWRRPVAAGIVPLAASALLYGGGYLVFSVSSDLRYHLWTELAALLALVLLLGDAEAPRGRRLFWTFAPAALAIAEGSVLRLALIG